MGPALWAFLSYMDLKKKEVREKQLHLYHDLIRRLVSPPTGGTLRIDSQIAIIYELTNFPSYYPVTERIFEGLKKHWTDPSHQRLIQELDIALETVRKKR